jgi:anti-sigma factor RsiW
MSACDDLRPAMSRVATGEADPSDSLDVARHLPGCTTCRILLAKERRLARILEHELEDAIGVDEEFLQGVMARLPDGPPPPRRRRSRRGLKIATAVGGWVLLGTAAAQWLAAIGAQRVPELSPRLDLPASGDLLEGLRTVAALASSVLSAIGAGMEAVPALLTRTPAVALGLVLPLGVLTVVTALVAVAALGKARRRRT